MQRDVNSIRNVLTARLSAKGITQYETGQCLIARSAAFCAMGTIVGVSQCESGAQPRLCAAATMGQCTVGEMCHCGAGDCLATTLHVCNTVFGARRSEPCDRCATKLRPRRQLQLDLSLRASHCIEKIARCLRNGHETMPWPSPRSNEGVMGEQLVPLAPSQSVLKTHLTKAPCGISQQSGRPG